MLEGPKGAGATEAAEPAEEPTRVCARLFDLWFLRGQESQFVETVFAAIMAPAWRQFVDDIGITLAS